MNTQIQTLTASVATLIERNDWSFEQHLRDWIDNGRSKRKSAKWSVRGIQVTTDQGHQIFKTATAAMKFASICRRCSTLSWAIHQSVCEGISPGCSVLSIRARVFIPGGVINVS